MASSMTDQPRMRLSQLGRRLPSEIKQPLRHLRNLATRIPYWGDGRYCPVCSRPSRSFAKYGVVPRADAQCVWCGSLERHRLTWLYFRRMTDLFDGRPKTMLHVAPEPCFEGRLRDHLGDGYLTADLNDPQAMVRMDITNIQYRDESFDVVYCSHVLEHVPDDRRAMRELRRVLKTDGWAILLVPISVAETDEDALVIDPGERRRRFGQEDHVRSYGPDYALRLQDTGFNIRRTTASDLSSADEAIRMGLTRESGDIFYCTR